MAKRIRNLVGVLTIAAVGACADAPTDPDIRVNVDKPGTYASPAAQVVEAEVVSANPEGATEFVRGDLGRVDESIPDAQLNAALASLGPMFNVRASQLRLERVDEDDLGYKHFRFAQVEGDLDVVGSEFVLHVDNRGSIYAVNGNAHAGFESGNVSKASANLADGVAMVKKNPTYAGAAVRVNRTSYVRDAAGQVHLAYETVAEGFRGKEPFVDKVYVSVATGETVSVHPTIHTAKSRKTYTANNGTSLPGTLVLTDGTGTTSDVVLQHAHDYTSLVYDMYKNLYGRDSIDGAGMTMISTVHYSNNYVNAFWNGSQMTYGDGDGVNASALVTRDIAGHEITHGVTERTSNLTYSGESGGINEANSDIFGAAAEWLDDGKVVSNDTWLVGEDCWTPGTPNDALRYMNDPAKDGTSPDLWYSGIGSIDVHYSSGIGNLAFYLLSQGGLHPRGKTNINVAGIGFEAASKIFFRANTVYLTSGSNYAAYRTALGQAANDLVASGSVPAGSAASVTQACDAVGYPGGAPPPPPPAIVLTNGTPVTGISGATGSTKLYSIVVPAGATNLKFVTSGTDPDPDIFVKFGSAPTTTVYDAKSDSGTANETVTVATPSAGTYYVLVYGYSAFTGLTLTGSFSTTTPPPSDQIQNGVAITGLADSGSPTFRTWSTATSVPSGKTLTVTISGGTGDADLYVRQGSAPTTTAYNCRPYKAGNSETCTITTTSAGTWFVALRDYAPYSGVTLKATW